MKALADYVYAHKRDYVGLEPVVKSLRIEQEELESVTAEELNMLIANYTSHRVQRFIKGLKRDLKL